MSRVFFFFFFFGSVHFFERLTQGKEIDFSEVISSQFS